LAGRGSGRENPQGRIVRFGRERSPEALLREAPGKSGWRKEGEDPIPGRITGLFSSGQRVWSISVSDLPGLPLPILGAPFLLHRHAYRLQGDAALGILREDSAALVGKSKEAGKKGRGGAGEREGGG